MTTSLPWIHVCYTEERWSGEGIAWIFPAGQSAEHLGTVSSSLLFRLRYPPTQKNIGLYWIGVAFLPFISTWRNWWCLTPISHIAYTCLRNMYNILPCPNHSFSPLPLSFQRGETKVLIWPGGIGHKQSICGDTILASGKRCPKPGDFALAKHKSYMENMFPIIQIGETTPSKSVNQNLLGLKTRFSKAYLFKLPGHMDESNPMSHWSGLSSVKVCELKTWPEVQNKRYEK